MLTILFDECTLVSIEGTSNGKQVNAVTKADLYNLVLWKKVSNLFDAVDVLEIKK